MIQELARGYRQTRVCMDTLVVIELTAPGNAEEELAGLTERAFDWFDEVELRCSRFDETSELRSLSRRIGEPIAISRLLFSALDLSLQVADLTGGALDPTVGRTMERSGFNVNYLTGKQITSAAPDTPFGTRGDIVLDHEVQTVTLLRPLSLDLGAVAKGFAIDLAGQELSGLAGFAINAGGDVLARGVNPDGESWQIGVRHPRRHDELLASLRISDGAVCTSGDYERRQSAGAGHHIIDPVYGSSADSAISATVVAPTAIVADALSTAVFVMGPRAGIEMLKRQGVDGMIVAPDLNVFATPGMENYQS